MTKTFSALTLAALVAGAAVYAQQPATNGASSAPFVPVTSQMLANPSPDDWLMFSRTYDAQRHSPLKQITKQNVGQLKEVFKKEFGAGAVESIPIVYRGVMYVLLPGNGVLAVNAATGEQIWEHKRANGRGIAKSLAIYDDMIYLTPPDGFVVALDARTGAVRWETKTSGRLTSGAVVVDGKVISGRACAPRNEDCYVAAHDAKTGKELWRFNTAARSDQPGGDTWGGAPDDTRAASTWGLAGAYDAQRRRLIWGVANPTPNTRANRHAGNSDAIPKSSPADLFSNSTIALDIDTGKLAWYYQHLPGDDWDQDYTNERTLFRTAVSPDPKFVKWINPAVKRGEQRNVAAMIGEGGGLWAIDKDSGQFLWATPFPMDTPNFLISKIDGDGKVHLNEDVMFKGPSDNRHICFWNTRSYFPTSYNPALNSLYTGYLENCLDMTSQGPEGQPRELRRGKPRPGSDPEKWSGLAKINMSTGEITYLHKQRAPSQGAVVTTATGLVFWGDLDHKFRAFDAESGTILWETALNGPVQNSTITYAVNGKQYVAVLTGVGGVTGGIIDQAQIKPNRAYNSLSVFALP
jgi:alcohol dehydrogenase (cytochrome c)